MVSRHVLAPVKPPAKKLTQQEFQESMQRLYDRPVQQAKKRRDQYDADVSAQTQVCPCFLKTMKGTELESRPPPCP